MKDKKNSHLPAVLMLGTLSQIGQVLLLRELLMVFQGNELSIGLILACWLFWVGSGSFLGPFLLKRFVRPLPLLMVSGTALLLILPTTILLIRGLRGFFPVLPGAYLSLLDIGVSSFLVTAPTGLLLGIQFILLSRIWREGDLAQDTSSAGKTYLGEAAGNMLGGILFTFLLVRYLNAIQSALLTVLFFLLSILFLWKRQGRGEKVPVPVKRTFFTAVLLSILLFSLSGPLDFWGYGIQWQQLTPQHQLIEIRQSKHGTIAVVERNDQYSFFQSGHLIFSTAGPQSLAPGLEEQEAVKFAHLSMVQHTHPEKVLLIGGGLRGLLSELVQYPVQEIHYVELDAVLTEAARPYVSTATRKALSDPRVHMKHTDGRLFVKETENRYDIIMMDIPDPYTAVLNRYYTKEFFTEAASRLNPGGVLITGVVSTPDLRGLGVANRNTTLYHTLSQVFPHVIPAGERFLFYFASNSPYQISVDASTLAQRFAEWDLETDGFSSHHYHVLLQETTVARVNWILRHHGRSPTAHLEGPGLGPLLPGSIDQQIQEEEDLPPVEEPYFMNSDFRPIGYYYTLLFWSHLTRSGGGSTLERMLQVKPWWVLPPLLLPLLLIIAYKYRRPQGGKHPKLALHLTVFTTGLSTMALQIALLFSFQSIYGFVYERVGLVVAIFMGGLALGTLFTHRFIPWKDSRRTLAFVQLIMALLAGMIAFLLPKTAAFHSSMVFLSFSSLTFLAGFINGVDFPLAAACSMAMNREAEKAAGTVYGLELMGACTGAALCSFLVAPILGIVACCLLAAIASITAFLALFLSGGVLYEKNTL